MTKKLIAGLLVASLSIPLMPDLGMSWYGGPPPPSGYHQRHHRNNGGDAWLWGLGGLVLGTAIVATAMQPTAQQVVYAEAPPPAYAYPRAYAPAQCRWERYVLDGYGRNVYDRYGQPLKEYTTGPCDYPPRW
jgi:hypothetical protein